MKYTVRVIPKASRVKVEAAGEARLRVHLTQPACDDKANTQLCRVLAAHFKVKKYQVTIVRGRRTREKTVRIDEPD